MKSEDLQPTDKQLSRRVAARGTLSELARRYRRFRPRPASQTRGDDAPADVRDQWVMGKIKADLLQTINADGQI